MASFNDNSGKEWEVRLDAPTIMRIRGECDPRFMLEGDGEDNTYQRLQTDPVLLCRVIFHACHKQRGERQISEETFYFDVIGDAIDAATDALLKAMQSFTPRRMRELLGAFAAKQTRIRQLVTEKALARLNDPGLEEALVAMVDKQIDAAFAESLTPPSSATSSPASAESAPTVES